MREVLKRWVLEAVDAHGGKASVVEVAKHIWSHHKSELEAAGDFFYTWQYEMRWAAQRLRDEGKLQLGGKRQWTRPVVAR